MTRRPARAGRRLPMPLAPTLRGYRRSWLGADALAGLTLLTIAVPEQLATSRLAGMPPVTGLYAFIAGTVAFGLLGSNPTLSVGADSTIAPLFAVGIAHLATTDSPTYISLVGLLAVVAGMLVMVVGLLRLGWIAEFLSAPIIDGFLAGVAVIIVVHQLPDLLGLPAVSGSTASRLRGVVGHLSHTNGWTLGIGAAVFATVVVTERVDRRIPGALVALVGSAAVVAAAGLRAHGVPVLGTVAHGAPHIGLTHLSWSSVGSVFPIAAVVALVIVTQSAVTSDAFARPGGGRNDVGRDFVGVGAGSVVAGLVGSFPVNASPARTAAVASAGGRTQAAGLGAALCVVVLVPAAGLLTDVPLATLAAVLIYIATRLLRVRELVEVLRFDLFEFALALVTLVTVALVGVEQGIAVAVGLAILDRTRRSARPRTYELGRIPGTTSWEPLEYDPHAQPVPGVVVFLFGAPLYFANAGYFRQQVREALVTPSPVHLLVLDADAVGDIDFTGTRALAQTLDELDRAHVTLSVARARGAVRRNLERSGLLDRIGRDRMFPSVDEAVTALGPG